MVSLRPPRILLAALLLAGCEPAPSSVAAAPSASAVAASPGSGPRRGGGRNQSARAQASAAPGQGAAQGSGAATLGDDEDGESRCPERIRRELVVEWEGKTLRQAEPEQALAELGKQRLPTGRHAGQPAIGLVDLGALAPEAQRVELVPCKGSSMTFDLSQASADPSRFVLVSAKRGAFKLMDRDGNEKKPMMKNIALVRLVR
jgi:hypothetical protein